ncbi:reverse transcriptase domain-containing protein [Tanacetum coccineum]
MPFGLKNAGATYQRMVDKAFDKQVGRNIEVYVDDLVIKSHTETEMLRDMDETFRTLRKINMKLNPKKYTFGGSEGLYLGTGSGDMLKYNDESLGNEFTYALRFQFTASNNETKYEALIAGLRITTQMGVCNVHVSVDSKLVANQVPGTYVAKEENMIKYLEKAKSLIELHPLQQMQEKAKESCMLSFRLLHSHLTALSNNDLKGTSIEGGFEWALATIFKQDHMESLRESIQERAKHKREYDRMMQSKEGNVDSSKALDVVWLLQKSIRQNQKVCFKQQEDSSKESYGSNDMAYNYYLEEAKKKTQDKNRNLKPREMPSARTHHTHNACKPNPRSNNQTSRIWPASKSSKETLKAVQKADHSRNPSSFLDSKHFVCSTCQKCVFNANHDACITKIPKEVNSSVEGSNLRLDQ